MIYSVNRAAHHLGIAPRTMRKYARLHGCARFGKQWMITPQELYEIHQLLLVKIGAAGKPARNLKKTLTPRASWDTFKIQEENNGR